MRYTYAAWHARVGRLERIAIGSIHVVVLETDANILGWANTMQFHDTLVVLQTNSPFLTGVFGRISFFEKKRRSFLV